jgi:hypothetical protein
MWTGGLSTGYKMTIAFDKIDTNFQALMSLPFQEGSGVMTRDQAKPGRQEVSLVGPPSWMTLASGLSVLEFNGAGDYGYCPAAETTDLDFTSEDYSFLCWLYKEHDVISNILFGRYGVDLDGWEIYLDDASGPEYLQLRHHHVSLTPDVRDGCYSTGWTVNTWWMMAITRSGLYPKHYRNGMEVEVTYDVGGLKDPDPCNRDLVIGTRYTKNANWWPGRMVLPRVCLGTLTSTQVKSVFDREAHWFGLN